MKRTIYLLFLVCTLTAMIVCMASAETEQTQTEQEALTYLSQELEESADHLMRDGEDVDDIYSTLEWASIADSFPTKFDLRDRGTITPVKSQNPWGTCWSFATIAASETSILNDLGVTAEQYREIYGEDMDLSEKHLAWFTAAALPELNAYPEGEYPYDKAQAGEGLHIQENADTNPFNLGGNYELSAGSLASGIGILKEKFAPYSNSEGMVDAYGDWTLPEEERFTLSFELLDANILPSPASYDENRNYNYRSAATEAIKTELMAGRAVGISFTADQSMPEMTKEEFRAILEETIAESSGGTEEEKARYIDVRVGDVDAADLSIDELKDLILLRLRLNNRPEDTYDLDSFDHDQLYRILNSRYFSQPYETIVDQEDNQKSYMSFIGEDPVIYAQYTDDALHANHAVTVVGWDDTFAAENWPEGHQPPGDGVWIVKNSWGEDWGTDGYFLLSYYDKTLTAIGSFQYIVSDDVQKMDYLNILQHDYMPFEITSSTLFDMPVYAANVFDVDEDSVLQYISVMTGDLNAEVTASVYLLDQDAVLPTDGILLDSKTQTFIFAGYHRMKLNSNLLLPKGSRISIVVLERVPGRERTQYALVNNSSLGKDGVETFNEIHADESRNLNRYAQGVVNRGESFVSFEANRWMDWTDAIAVFAQYGANVYIAYDNLPIKAYIYPWSQVQEVHDLSHRIPTAGGEAAICPEDGYLLLDLTHSEENKTTSESETDSEELKTVLTEIFTKFDEVFNTAEETGNEEALSSIFSYRFADAKEAAEMLLANRNYYENLSQNDLNFRMQKLDATLEELEVYAAEQTLDWSDEEKAAIDAAMNTIEQICREKGYTLPPTDNIIFVKTTMHEEMDAGAYTHGTEIYLGEYLLQYGLKDDPIYQNYFKEVLTHELFHCLTRNNPEFRKAMYGILGFTVAEKDFDFPQEIRNLIISNPDVEHHNSYSAFLIGGEMKDCTVIFTTEKQFEKPGDSFFNDMVTGLVPIDDLSVMYRSEEAENFWDVFGRNTSYVIDPEETLANNFSFTIIYGINGQDYETPEIIESIDAFLKQDITY